MKIRNIVCVVLAMVIAFAGGAITMAQVIDWHDVEKVRHAVREALDDINRIDAANGGHMGGHGIKAEEHLRAADRELQEGIEYMRNH